MTRDFFSQIPTKFYDKCGDKSGKKCGDIGNRLKGIKKPKKVQASTLFTTKTRV